jgi:hypothetical protein
VDVHDPGAWLTELRATSGAVRLVLAPEIDVDLPVEVMVAGNRHLSDQRGGEPVVNIGFVTADMVGISVELEDDLRTWLRWWQDQGFGFGDDDFDDAAMESADWQRWRDRGAVLRDRLQGEVGPAYDVVLE